MTSKRKRSFEKFPRMLIHPPWGVWVSWFGNMF